MFFSLKSIFPAVTGFIWKVFADSKTCDVRIHFHQIFKKLKQSDPITLRVGPNEVSTASMTRLVRNHRKWVAKILVLLLDLAGYKDTVTWDGFIYVTLQFCSLSKLELCQVMFYIVSKEMKSWTVHYVTSSQLEEFYDDYYTCPVPAFNTSSIDFAKLPLAKYRMQDFIELCYRPCCTHLKTWNKHPIILCCRFSQQKFAPLLRVPLVGLTLQKEINLKQGQFEDAFSILTPSWFQTLPPTWQCQHNFFIRRTCSVFGTFWSHPVIPHFASCRFGRFSQLINPCMHLQRSLQQSLATLRFWSNVDRAVKVYNRSLGRWFGLLFGRFLEMSFPWTTGFYMEETVGGSFPLWSTDTCEVGKSEARLVSTSFVWSKWQVSWSWCKDKLEP